MININPIVMQRVTELLGSNIHEGRLVAKDEFTLLYELGLTDGRQVHLRLPSFGGNAPIVEAEVATLRFLASHNSIPVPQVLAFEPENDRETSSPCFALLQKPSGVCVEALFPSMTTFEQNLIVATIARWMIDLYQHRFEAIGSLRIDSENGFRVGPVVLRLYYADGRSKLSLDRGPFSTARGYYRACAQRELDSSRMLFVQDAPPSYQQDLEDNRLMVERIAGLLCDLTNQCEGLDEDDLDMAPFSLDIHEIGLKNIYVSPENPTNILSVVDWQFVNTRPLWCCARVPPWMCPSLSSSNVDTNRFAAIFRAEAVRVAGPTSSFLHAIMLEDTRTTLDELSAYDAFRDGFLLLPALENILATLPGHEDVAGLTALLDPTTLPGRVARITLLTRGSNAMYLAMTPPRSPLMGPVKEEGTKTAIPSDSGVLVS